MNLLFLAPHWKAPLVRAFIKTRDRMGIQGCLAGADSDPQSAALKLLHPNIVLPPFNHPQCLPRLLEFCEAESIDSVIPFTNKAVEFLVRHRERPELENRTPLLSPAKTVSLCHDKLKLARALESEGFSVPQTQPISSLKNPLTFPLFAKKRRGEGGKDCFAISSSNQLADAQIRFPDHVVQEFITGREYSFDWLSDPDGRPALIVPRVRLRVHNGECQVGKIETDPILIEAARELGTRLGLRGPCNLQGILSPGGKLYWTDVNLRFGAGAVHSIAAGNDIPGMLYEDLLRHKSSQAYAPKAALVS